MTLLAIQYIPMKSRIWQQTMSRALLKVLCIPQLGISTFAITP